MGELKQLSVYRDNPPDVAYTERVEAANCDWCRWWDYGNACKHPLQKWHATSIIHPDGRQYDWNSDGQCERSQLTIFTRLLRRLGLRGPAWRDPV